jgi:hypothetical protein
MTITQLTLASIAAALLAGASPAVAEQAADASIVALVAATANSPSTHQALARFYSERASLERARARHMRGAARHRVGKLGASSWTAAHIDPGNDNEAAAVRYEKLAAMHQQEAVMLGRSGS